MSKFTNFSNAVIITKYDTAFSEFMTYPPDEIIMPITEAVSEVLETPVEALPLLSDAIDVDALAALMTGDPAHEVIVSFDYAGLHVLVHSDRTVYVRPRQNA